MPLKAFIPATVARTVLPPYGALWNVHLRRTVMKWFATVLGPLNEQLKGEIYIGAKTTGNI